jgi:IS605 OrfB family transposase
MKLTRTAKIKLDLQVDEAMPTLLAYTKAYNFVCQEGYSRKNFNGVTLHKLTYETVREYLPAQLAISSRMKSTESLKAILKKRRKYVPKCPVSNLCAIRYDKNSYSLFPDRQELSLLLISGRRRLPLHISEYHQQYFSAGWKHCSADLCISGQSVYLHIVFEKDIPDTSVSGKIIGVDRGINNLAVTSEARFYNGKQVKKRCDRFRQLRKQLQKKGTKSAKRHLARLAGKERRFKADINHQVAKQIVNDIKPGDTIVLENLSGIRNNKRRKAQRIMVNGWNFLQLEEFLVYKAEAKGIAVEYIDPRYTSQHCLACGNTSRNNRDGALFSCRKCHFKMNADLVGSKNILLKYLGALHKQGGSGFAASHPHANPAGLSVNQPIVGVERLLTSPRL